MMNGPSSGENEQSNGTITLGGILGFLLESSAQNPTVPTETSDEMPTLGAPGRAPSVALNFSMEQLATHLSDEMPPLNLNDEAPYLPSKQTASPPSPVLGYQGRLSKIGVTDIPDKYVDPITFHVMDKPVICASSKTKNERIAKLNASDMITHIFDESTVDKLAVKDGYPINPFSRNKILQHHVDKGLAKKIRDFVETKESQLRVADRKPRPY